jgi:hypothetical protein
VLLIFLKVLLVTHPSLLITDVEGSFLITRDGLLIPDLARSIPDSLLPRATH